MVFVFLLMLFQFETEVPFQSHQHGHYFLHNTCYVMRRGSYNLYRWQKSLRVSRTWRPDGFLVFWYGCSEWYEALV